MNVPSESSAHGLSQSRPEPPVYIDALIDDFAAGVVGRFNHLGHWPIDDDDPVATGRSKAQRRMVDVLADVADVRDRSTVLDVGSGFGGTLLALGERCTDVALIGLDIDRRQLALCLPLKAQQGNGLGWVQADGCRLPIGDALVDHVVCIEAMWHFPTRSAFLAEAARVLRPGGNLVLVDLLVEPGAAAAVGLAEDVLLARLREGFAPWPTPHLTLDELVRLGEAAGLTTGVVIDATENTKGSYLDHGDAEQRPGASSFSASPAVQLFVDLHRRDLLHVVYVRFDRLEQAITC